MCFCFCSDKDLFLSFLQVHLEYLEAGADILVTSSYQVCLIHVS